MKRQRGFPRATVVPLARHSSEPSSRSHENFAVRSASDNSRRACPNPAVAGVHVSWQKGPHEAVRQQRPRRCRPPTPHRVRPRQQHQAPSTSFSVWLLELTGIDLGLCSRLWRSRDVAHAAARRLSPSCKGCMTTTVVLFTTAVFIAQRGDDASVCLLSLHTPRGTAASMQRPPPLAPRRRSPLWRTISSGNVTAPNTGIRSAAPLLKSWRSISARRRSAPATAMARRGRRYRDSIFAIGVSLFCSKATASSQERSPEYRWERRYAQTRARKAATRPGFSSVVSLQS
jgi:hypothetical protein